MTKKKSAPSKPSKSPTKAVAEEKPQPVKTGDESSGDGEELDEDEVAASSSGGGGNAAALAAAGSGEMSASFKNFRHHPDMENFYRFIFENDLRHEALAIMNQMVQQKQTEKLAKKR